MGRYEFDTHRIGGKRGFSTAVDLFAALKAKGIYRTRWFRRHGLFSGCTDLSYRKTLSGLNDVREQPQATSLRTLNNAAEHEAAVRRHLRRAVLCRRFRDLVSKCVGGIHCRPNHPGRTAAGVRENPGLHESRLGHRANAWRLSCSNAVFTSVCIDRDSVSGGIGTGLDVLSRAAVLWMNLTAFLLFLLLSQLYSTLSILVTNTVGIDKNALGFLYAINGSIVIFF